MRKIKSGDKVIVISGKDKWTISEVEKVIDWIKVVVKDVNKVKRAKKGHGFIEKTLPIDLSNVSLYCDKCKKAVRSTIKVDSKGMKKRHCIKCDNAF